MKENKIISISLKPETLDEINKIEQELGFSGRSELIRAGLRLLVEDKKEKEKMKGSVDAILIIKHKEMHEDVSAIRHKHSSLIKSQMHNHVNHNCLETFIINGDAKKVKKMFEEFQSCKRIQLVKLVLL